MVINDEDNNQGIEVGHKETKHLSNATKWHYVVITFNTDIVFTYKHHFKEEMSYLNDISETGN